MPAGARSGTRGRRPKAAGPWSRPACFESEFEPLLGVYAAASPGQLQPVAAGQEASLECGRAAAAPASTRSPDHLLRSRSTAEPAKRGNSNSWRTSISPAGRRDTTISSRRSRSAPTCRRSPSPAGTPPPASSPASPTTRGEPGGHSVWYSWTPNASGRVRIATCSAARLDPLLAVYTGSSLPSLTEVAAQRRLRRRRMPPADSAVSFDAVAGTRYEIAVDGKAGSVGRFELLITGPPANDEFANAARLSSKPPRRQLLDHRCSPPKQPGEPDHGGEPGGHSVWFKWTAPATGSVEVSACALSPGFEPLLAAYSGAALESLAALGDHGPVPSGLCGEAAASATSFDVVAGTTYRLAVDGRNETSGQVKLTLQGTPANDDFGDARTLAGLAPAPLTELDRFATKQPGEPDHAGDPGGHSVWFKWTAPREGPVSVGTAAAVRLPARRLPGSSLPPWPGAEHDDSGGRSSPDSHVSFDATAGVSSDRRRRPGPDGHGLLSLRIAGRPANDDLGSATVLPPALPRPCRARRRWPPRSPASPTTLASPAATRSGTRGRRTRVARSRSKPVTAASTPCWPSTPARRRVSWRRSRATTTASRAALPAAGSASTRWPAPATRSPSMEPGETRATRSSAWRPPGPCRRP